MNDHDQCLRDNLAEVERHLLRFGLPTSEAESEAARITGALARNLGYSWDDLRAALSDRPALLALLPSVEGTVDRLPLGLATYALRVDGGVRRQGAYVEAPP